MEHFLKGRSWLLIVYFFCGYFNSFAQCPAGYIKENKNLITNGDFSQGYIGFQSEYEYTTGRHETLPGKFSITSKPHWNNLAFSGKGNGNMLAVDGGKFGLKVWSQNVKVEPRTVYMFTLYLTTLSMNGLRGALQLEINGKKYGLTVPYRTFEWNRISGSWNSENFELANLSIKNLTGLFDGNDWGIDNIQLYKCIPALDSSSIKRKEVRLKSEQKPNSKQINIVKKATKKSTFISLLEEGKEGDKIEIRKLLFVQSKAFLKAESYKVLDELAVYMKDNPRLKIELSGHTDNVGVPELNLELSRDRVSSVKEYLVAKDILPVRIKEIGYGGDYPISSNSTEEGRQHNRRVEIKILER